MAATSTRVRESAILPVSADTAWQQLRELDFATLFPGQVAKCELKSGVVNTQGTVRVWLQVALPCRASVFAVVWAMALRRPLSLHCHGL